MKKRLLSAVLTLCMMLTLLPVNALATESEASEAPSLVKSNISEVSQATEPESNVAQSNDDSNGPEALLAKDSSDISLAAEHSGNCGDQGDNVKWELNSSGELTISGFGKMKDYNEFFDGSTDSPWDNYCNNIKSISIAPGITSIGNYAFSGCDIKTVLIPNSVTDIGKGSFAGCSLTSITLPSSITSIGGYAFDYCIDLRSVDISPSITTISNNMFNECYSLSSIVIPEGVRFIEYGAFATCDTLTSIVIPSSVTFIGESSFNGCIDLKNIYYTGSETDWKAVSIDKYNDSLSKASMHYNSTGSNTIIRSGNCGDQGDNIKWTLDNVGTLTISGTGKMKDYSYQNNSVNTVAPWFDYEYESEIQNTIKSIIVGNGVTHIGNFAFGEDHYEPDEGFACINLETVSLPDTLLSIGSDAFAKCGLKSIVIPDSVISIKGAAFSRSELESVIIPQNVSELGSSTFSSCMNLRNISVSPNNKYFASEDGVLFNKDKTILLTCPAGKQGSYTIPNNVTTVGTSSFRGSRLTSVVIPNSVTTIESYAFYGSHLTAVTIPSSVTEIQMRTFRYAGNLSSVVIPVSVTKIDEWAFQFTDLKDVYYAGTEAQWKRVKVIDEEELAKATIHYNSTGPNTSQETGKYRILIYANRPLLANQVGDLIDFRCVLYTDKNQGIPWVNPSVVVDNNDIVNISGYYDEAENCYFTVKGLKEGNCTFTVTDSATGVYGKFSITFGRGLLSTESCCIDQVPSFKVNESAWLFGEKFTQTNFYDVSGLYVNGFAYKLNSKKNAYEITFNAYNSRYYYGAVDIYDANGKWIETEKIDKVLSTHSVQATVGDAWNLITDLVVEKKGLSYTLSSSTKETPINISVPVGGYFTVSNNIVDSPGTYLFNMIDFLLMGLNAGIDAGIDIPSASDPKSNVSVFQKLLTKNITDKSFSLTDLNRDVAKQVQRYAVNAFSTAGLFNLGEAVSVATCSFEELLSSLDIDLETIAKSELNIAESQFKKLSGPAGAYLTLMFTAATYLDYIAQLIEFSTSKSNPYIQIYAVSSSDSLSDMTVGDVTVSSDDEAIENGSVLQVFKIKFDDDIPEVDGTLLPDGQYATYNIRFVKNGEVVQPNKEVTVKISIPDGYKNENCIVLRKEEDGTWTKLPYKITGNIISFRTSHFSVYAVVDLSSAASSVHLKEDNISLKVSESYRLNLEVMPQDASQTSLIWESSNPLVAKVNNLGVVNAFSAGNAKITVKTPSGYIDECTVVVTATVPSTSYRITLDSTGGTIDSSVLTTDANGKLSGLPTPTYVNHIFDGWYTSASGGERITVDTVFSKDTTVYAHWTYAGNISDADNSTHDTYQPGNSGDSSPALKPLPSRNPDRSSTPTQTVPQSTFFTDVPANYWAVSAIYWVNANGYMKGTSETTFTPDGKITRQAVWMILARLSGVNPANMEEARAWAINNGVSDGSNPTASMTRQQMVAFLYRYSQLKGYPLAGSSSLTNYPDSGTVADYAKDAMSWAVGNSIVAGTKDGTLNPNGSATRAQFAVILQRFHNSIVST